jgi:hypothetical protein
LKKKELFPPHRPLPQEIRSYVDTGAIEAADG